MFCFSLVVLFLWERAVQLLKDCSREEFKRSLPLIKKLQFLHHRFAGRTVTPTPFISHQHHSRVKICWQTVAAFCISRCALCVHVWKLAASLQQLLPCLWTSAPLWCCQVIKVQVMLEGTWVAHLCKKKKTWAAPHFPYLFTPIPHPAASVWTLSLQRYN